MRTHRRWHWCALAALYLETAAAAAAPRAPVELAIEVRDLARVPSAVMRETKAQVEQTFLASGVRIVWVEPGESPRDRPPLNLIVVGASTPGAQGDRESGATVLGMAPDSGDWAQVFYGRVAAAVAQRQIPVSLVLAHVVSHEIGHLLLPPNSHVPFGIMRRAVDLEHPSLRRFTGDQPRLIREAVASGQRFASRCLH